MTLRAGIALAAVAVTLTAPQAVMAKAAPAQSAELQAAMEQIRILQQQVADLQARMDRQDASAQQVTLAAQEASEKADAALAQASAANTTAVAANDAAAKAGKSAEATKWASNTRISGRMYYNISNVSAKTDGVRQENQGGFAIKRFYVDVDHKFDDTFSGNVTMDIDNVANSAGKNVGKGFYVKKAYLQARLDKALTVRLGAADTPWVPYAEGLYGYRHLEKETVDLFGYGTSADWGVHAFGEFADGLVSYQVSAMDGGGYRDPKFTNTVDLEGRVAIKYKGFNAAIGGYTGKLGNDFDGATTAYRTASRFNALVAYKDKVSGMPVTLGGEYFTAKNWKVATTAAADKAEGYSVFASIAPMDKVSVFGRYDWTTPNKDTAPGRKGEYFNLGVQYSPAKIVDLALMFKHYSGENGFKGGDFSYGSTYVSGSRSEFGLYGQFRF